MKSILLPLPLALALGASTLFAQNCPDRTLGIGVGSGDDVMSAMQSIGFTFPFAGATYTNVHICTNGYLQLSNAGVPAPGAADYSATAAELASGSPRICPLWHDLNIAVANGAQLYINSTPTRCTITWDRAVNYGLTTLFQLQVQLFPSGEVKMFYSPGVTNNSTYNYAAGIGLAGVSPGLGATLPAATNLSAGGATVDNSLHELWPIQTTFDMAYQCLQLTPAGPGWVYQASSWSGCAAAADYGTGCISVRDSFYEVMPVAGFDLGGTTMTLLRSPNGYLALNGISGVFVPPSPSALIVANADDIVQTVALSSPMPVAGGGTTGSLSISSNGNIALAVTGNGAGFAPEAGLFLAFAQTSIAAVWHDYNPAAAGSGKILFEEIGGISYVTWDNVYSYNSTQPDQFQYQFDRTTGNVTIVYVAFSGASNNYLVGYSVGGPSPRPEASDLSVALVTGISVADVGVRGLTLTASGEPFVGNGTFGLSTSDAPNLFPLAFLFFGDAAIPGIDLGFLGAPGCRAYTNANLGSATFPLSLPAGTGTAGLPIPPSIGLIGVSLTCQSAAFTLANPLGLVTSNGTRFVVGL